MDLVSSVVALEKKSSNASKSTLFRSDSINKKKVETVTPFEVEIQEKKLSCREPN
jgi:hypothetical protein